jgi:hypothetical protein
VGTGLQLGSNCLLLLLLLPLLPLLCPAQPHPHPQPPQPPNPTPCPPPATLLPDPPGARWSHISSLSTHTWLRFSKGSVWLVE